MSIDAMTEAELRRVLEDCRNELCLKCGRYQEAHKGSCEGCRWQMEGEFNESWEDGIFG